MSQNKLCKITPTLAVEVFKMTYDFEYFRGVSERAISAGWPDIAKDSAEFMTLVAYIHDSFDIVMVKNAVKDWTGENIVDFFVRFDDVFSRDGLVNHYVVVQEFFKVLAVRWYELQKIGKLPPDVDAAIPRKFQWIVENKTR